MGYAVSGIISALATLTAAAASTASGIQQGGLANRNRRLGQSQGVGSDVPGVTAGNFAATPSFTLQPSRSENWQTDMRLQQAMPAPDYGPTSVPPNIPSYEQQQAEASRAPASGSEMFTPEGYRQKLTLSDTDEKPPPSTAQPSSTSQTLRDANTAIQIGTTLASLVQAASPGAPPPAPRLQGPMSNFQPTSGRFVNTAPMQQQQDLQRMRLQRAYVGQMR